MKIHKIICILFRSRDSYRNVALPILSQTQVISTRPEKGRREEIHKPSDYILICSLHNINFGGVQMKPRNEVNYSHFVWMAIICR